MRNAVKSGAARAIGFSSLIRLLAIVLLGMAGISRAHAGATLLLEEPYSYDGTFAGTGHVAVYLSGVCSVSPVKLRPCGADESGVVLSRYDGISGYDWVAIPLIPYLYAVDREESIPLFSDTKLVAFLRDQYRREHLELVAPDQADGTTPAGNWYELVGSSYDRTIYGFEIETTPAQDARLIAKFNSEPNVETYNFVKRNCADFVKDVVNFYYPHALHRSLFGDLGVTTPKQIAKMMAKYEHHHSELQSSVYIMPQVPGGVRRSKPIHGVLESIMAAKKYMLPIVILHPYIGGGLLAEHFFHKGFDPSKNAAVMNSDRELEAAMTREQRATYQSRMDELSLSLTAAESLKEVKTNDKKEVKSWERMQAGGTPGLDAEGRPMVDLGADYDLVQVGLSRGNLLSDADSSGFGARLMQARLQQELKASKGRKTSRGDVEKDLLLYQRLLLLQPKEAVAGPVAVDPTQ